MGLDSRDYVRYSEQPTEPRFPLVCPIVLFVFWLIGAVSIGWFRSTWTYEFLALSNESIGSGKLWTVLTYPLVHGGLFHILFNAIALFFIGRSLCTLHGDRHTTLSFLGGCLAGGIAWLLLEQGLQALGWPHNSGMLMGCSPGLNCLVFGFLLHRYYEPLTIYLFFGLFPLTLKGWQWMLAFFAVDFILFAVEEMAPGGGGMGYIAHLAGMTAGLWIYAFRIEPWKAESIPVLRPFLALARLFKKKNKPAPSPRTINPSHNRLDTPSGAPTKAEIDRVLDKINEHGFGALTPKDKEILERARRH